MDMVTLKLLHHRMTQELVLEIVVVMMEMPAAVEAE
jgi:hypothetical protein